MIRRFRDWRIGKKLFYGFGVIVFFLVVVGGYTIFSQINIKQKTREVESHDFYCVKLATALSETILKVCSAVGDTFATGKQNALEELDINREKFHILAAEFKDLIRSDTEQYAELGEVEKNFDEYCEVSQRLISSFNGEKFEAGKETALEFYKLDQELRHRLDPLSNEYVARFSQSLGNIYDLADNAERFNLLLSVFTVLFGMLLAWRMTRFINSSIRQLIEGSENFAKGELGYRITPRSKDELGQLALSFNWMAESLAESIDDIKVAADKWETVFVNSFQDWVLICDKDSRIIKANNAFLDAFKIAPEVVVGRTYCRIVRGAQADGCPCPDKEAKKTKKETVSEFFEPRLGLFLEAAVSPILDNAGDISKIVLIIKDITARKEVEKEQRLTQLGRLVSNIAHEVNNPLMIISGRAQLALLEDIKDENLKKNFEIITKECQRAKGYIANLLQFSRPSKGEVERTDINKVLEDIVLLVEHQFALSGVELNKHFAKGLPAVWVDAKQMQEVFLNIINNARDAVTAEKGRIDVVTSLEKSYIRIDIADSGPGVTQEVISHMFEPFYTTKKSGTGLGLYISYGIIKAHKGELKADSVIGKGTKITVLLPIDKEKENG
jgi:PAS domain S-box-containing protein